MRYNLFHQVSEFLNSNHGGSFKLGFFNFTLKITSLPEYDQFYILIKNRILFIKRVFFQKDLLYLLFVLMSFFHLKSKYEKYNHFVFDENTTLNIKKLNSSSFCPSPWVVLVINWFLKPYKKGEHIILAKENDSSIYEWLLKKEYGRYKIGHRRSNFLIVRTPEQITVHFFYSQGGHFIFTFRRTEDSLRDLFVLMRLSKPVSPLLKCVKFPREYKSYDLPYYLWFWT